MTPDENAAGSVPVPELPHDAILASYFAGEDDPAVADSVAAWVGRDERRREMLERLRAGWNGAGRSAVAGDLQQFMHALWARIHADESTAHLETPRASNARQNGAYRSVGERQHGERSGPRALRWMWAGIAAATVVAAFILIQPRALLNSGVTRSYATTLRQRATLTLDDGTRVTLAPQTTLHLDHFGASSRTVALEGEAYFEVPHAAGVPFIVRSGGMATRVLGTGFVVRHYAEDTHAHVAVATGRVSVSSLSGRFATVTVPAGRVGEMTDSTIILKPGDDVASDTRWTQGELLFHDAPVREVLATLHRWYGYQFRCTDPALAQQVVTVALSTQSSSASLAILEQVLSIDLTIVGDTVTLAPRTVRPLHRVPRAPSYDVWTPTKEVGR